MTRADWRLDFSPIPFLDESVQTEVRRFNTELEEACANCRRSTRSLPR